MKSANLSEAVKEWTIIILESVEEVDQSLRDLRSCHKIEKTPDKLLKTLIVAQLELLYGAEQFSEQYPKWLKNREETIERLNQIATVRDC